MIALLIGLLVIALDQITKIIIVAAKPVGTGHGFIEFNLTYNTGAAFSFMDDNTLFLAILSLIATIILIYIAFKHFKFNQKKLIHISIGLLIGGAAGNMIDRFLTVFGVQKGVVDFIVVRFGSWEFPGTFNVADFFLVTGVCLIVLEILVLDTIKKHKQNKHERLSGNDNENN